MGFKLLPNKVYATQPIVPGVVIFQPVNGDIQLYGSNITQYKLLDGKKKLIIPEFDNLIKIWDDMMKKDTVNTMTCLTSWIGFTSEEPLSEVWLNMGINETITPTDIRLSL